MESVPTLTIEGVSVRFRILAALDQFSLKLRESELVALIGPNGAGKSTVLRAVARQIALSDGRISVAGHDIATSWPTVKPLIGYVPDKDNHFEEFTGRRNLHFFAKLYCVDARRADECLQLVQLTAAADRAVSGYSLGMRRRLLVARALLHRPRLLLLDEPLANLDDDGVALVRDILIREREQGTAVLLTTPLRESMNRFWDREVRLVAGRVVE